MNFSASFLRFLSALAVLSLVIAVFAKPIDRAVRRHLPTANENAEVDPEHDEMPPAPAPSFLLEITSVPSGARIMIGRGERGTTPAVANVRCKEGEDVVVTVVAPGYDRWLHQLTCHPGDTVTLRADLAR
jgi:hypothetical protein